MRQGRLATDREYAAKIQRNVYKLVRNKSNKILPISGTNDYLVFHIDGFDRYIVIDEFGTIIETANGWGYKSFASAEKAALYVDMQAEMRAQRIMRKYRSASSYDIDMEMADCYYGYNHADFY